MVYCVFLDPACIEEADQVGEFGYATLFEIMLGLLQNCFLADTKSWSVGGSLSNAVQKIQDQDARKRAIELLVLFQNRNRFLDVIECDADDVETPCGAVAVADWENPRLNHLILGRDIFQDLPKTSTLPTYPMGGFSRERSESVYGKTVRRGHYSFSQIFAQHFACIVRESSVIKLIDPVAGEFTANYVHNIPLWINELDDLGTGVSVELHTAFKEPRNFTRLGEFISDHCRDSSISFKIVPYLPKELPHERFLIASHFTLVIGRGIDLVDPADMRNRDLFISHAVPPTLPQSNFQP